MDTANHVIWIIGILGCGLILFSIKDIFSNEARERRRRARNYRRVVPKVKRPVVTLLVNTR